MAVVGFGSGSGTRSAAVAGARSSAVVPGAARAWAASAWRWRTRIAVASSSTPDQVGSLQARRARPRSSRGLEPLRRVLGQGLVQDHADARADAVDALQVDGRRRLGDDLEQDGGGVVAGERLAPGEGLVEHHPHGEQVRLGGGVAFADVLGRHVAHRAHDDAGGGHVAVLHPGDAEIHDLGQEVLAVAHHPDIGGLDVPVDDAVAVGVAEPVAHLGQHLQELGGGQAPCSG